MNRSRDVSKVVHVVGLLAVTATAAACGGAPRATDHQAGAEAAVYELRFTGAALPARRASGAPWHTGQADTSSILLGGLIGLAVGYPAAGAALGASLVTDPEPEAPAPYVLLKIAGDTYAVSPVGQTLAPSWAQPIAIPARRYPADTPALIQIRDAIGDGVLGQEETTVGALLVPGARTITEVGEVASLDVEVRPMAARAAGAAELFVDPARSLAQLAAGKDPRWIAVPVWNGDRITVRAEGEVCPSRPTPCFDADGADLERWSNWQRYNYDAFSDAPHASLVALLPGQAVPVGREATFVAEQAGLMLLFVNDTDEDNNAGGFVVHVAIEPAAR